MFLKIEEYCFGEVGQPGAYLVDHQTVLDVYIGWRLPIGST